MTSRSPSGLLLAVVCWCFIMVSCSTLPAPSSDDDTALAIPIELVNTARGGVFGTYTIFLRRHDGSGDARSVRLNWDTEYQVVTGLAPGWYSFDSYQFRYASGRAGSSGPLGGTRFELVRGALTVSPEYFYILLRPHGDGTRSSIRLAPTSRERRSNILAALEEQPGFADWRVE